MRFRVGLVVGFGAGYVMGAKAGRERYEQMARSWREFRRSEPAQQIERGVRTVAEQAKEQIQHKASESVERVTERVKERVGRGEHDEDTLRFPNGSASTAPGMRPDAP